MSGPIPMSVLTDKITALKEKLSGDALKAAIEETVNGLFDPVVAKCVDYKSAHELFENSEDGEDRFFNALSLGNWLYIAAAAQVPIVQARMLGVAKCLNLFSDAMGNPRNDHTKEDLERLDEDIQTIRDDEMLRFDACGSSVLKADISEGKGYIAGQSRGYIRSQNGHVDHFLCKRLADAFLWHTEEQMPVWARPIIKARQREGWNFHTGQLGTWPVEWRVYVENGKVRGVSNYYPQAPAPQSDMPQALAAVELTETLMEAMRVMNVLPHHPRYEKSLDVTKQSFSADFIVREDGKMLFLEGGPAHILSPAFGAHPCCFNPHVGIDGIALGQGDVRPLPDRADAA